MDPWAAAFLLVGLIGSVLFAIAAPYWITRSHLRNQNRLIERCRAYYVLAVEALGGDNDDVARQWLHRIQRIESRWRYGNSILYRVALAAYCILIGFLGCAVLRVASLVPVEWPHLSVLQSTPDQFAVSMETGFALGLSGAVWALHSVFSEWRSPSIVDDCGERLARMLAAGRSIGPQIKAEKGRARVGLTAEQLFGLEKPFTLKELSSARRRLASQFHPDRWHGAHPAQRRAAEAAMKRINAAFDELRSEAV